VSLSDKAFHGIDPATCPAAVWAGNYTVTHYDRLSETAGDGLGLRHNACDITEFVIPVGVVIKSFAERQTRVLFETGVSRRWSLISRVAVRKLVQIDSVAALEELNVPPGNRLEALKGDRAGLHSIRINDQWRICFRWESDGVYDVQIIGYH